MQTTRINGPRGFQNASTQGRTRLTLRRGWPTELYTNTYTSICTCTYTNTCTALHTSTIAETMACKGAEGNGRLTLLSGPLLSAAMMVASSAKELVFAS